MKTTEEINQAADRIEIVAKRARERVERGYADHSPKEKREFVRDVLRYRAWAESCHRQRNWEGLEQALQKLNKL